MRAKVIYFLIVLLIAGKASSFAQSVTVTGKILDLTNSKPIIGVTIKCNNFGTSSLKDGNFRFIVQKEQLQKFGLTLTCIGYETLDINYQKSSEFTIKMKPSSQMLMEVIVGISALEIVKKAIIKISDNYPQKDFTTIGYIKLFQTVKKDSINYKFFTSEAIVKTGVTPYSKNPRETKVTVLQNRNLNVDSLQKEEEYVPFVNGFLMAKHDDYVHERVLFFNPNNLDKYEFSLNGKTMISGRKSYVINFNTLKKQNREGTIYIDTATYAIAKLNMSSYNIEAAGYIKIDESSIGINYQKINRFWYLQNIHYNNSANHNHLRYNRIEDYHTLKIDSTKLDLDYINIVQDRTEDLKQIKTESDSKWKPYEEYIDSLRTSNQVASINPPKGYQNMKNISSFYKSINGIRKYAVNGGISILYKINYSQLSAVGFQPLINKTITGISNYNLSVNILFRLHKNLFFEYGGGKNYGLGGLDFKQIEYCLRYNFNLNNEDKHPIFLSPSFGYSNTNLKIKKDILYNQKAWVYGLSFTYEKKRSLSFVLSFKYFNQFSEKNIGLNIIKNNFQPSIGILRKF